MRPRATCIFSSPFRNHFQLADGPVGLVGRQLGVGDEQVHEESVNRFFEAEIRREESVEISEEVTIKLKQAMLLSCT